MFLISFSLVSGSWYIEITLNTRSLSCKLEADTNSAVYSDLAETILPQLRRSRLTANIEIIGKSDDEISALAKSNPSELNIEEILYAATLTNNDSEKMAIYTKASELYPNCYRTWNNIGSS